MDPLIRSSLATFAAKIMQQEVRLSVMPTVNVLGLFEGIIIEYVTLLDR